MKKFLQTAGRSLSYVLVAVLASVVTLVSADLRMPAAPASQPSKLDQLKSHIENRFIGEVDSTAIEDAAAHAMVGALGDRWSYYVPASEYQDLLDQANNSYVGVGITIRMSEDGTGFDILSVEPTGPAAEAGILAGDVMVAVSGQSCAGMTTAETGPVVKGEEGTTVDITVRRGGEEITFTVERRRIQMVVAEGEMLENGIGLVTIANFDSRCFDETVAAIEALLEQGATSLIFDVRNNPGGYKDELVDILDYLLPEGPLFRSEKYDGTTSVDESDAACLEMPMAVLVNRDSYSAAEFFAAALDEYDYAVVVGEQTCGKGYFQYTTELCDGSAVALSTGKYFTPNGVSLAEVGGLTPEILVEVDDDTFSAIYAGTLEPADDPQIQAAVQALTEQ